MHQKKSDVQIGKDSFGLSSDFSPSAAAHHHQLSVEIPPPSSPNGPHSSSLLSKRPVMTHSPTLSSLRPFSSPRPPPPPPPATSAAAAAARNLVPTQQAALRLLRRLRLRLRLFILLSLPSLYLLLTRPTRVFVLDLLLAFAFSAALFASVALALPRLPSLRPLCLKLKLPSSPIPRRRPAPSPPRVLWFIGSHGHKPSPDDPASSGAAAAVGGLSVQVYSNGDVYEGEFHRGKCSGSGVYHYYMSGRYEGDWVDEKYDGYGVETWARGSRYRGQYRKGMRHGFGVYRFYTGDVYAGEWSNGQSHGCGVHTCEDGSRYVGEFKWGVKHGLGHYHFRNGDTYSGEYFSDKMHGFGVYQFANGHRYEGAWHEGRRQGLGMYTFRNGETQSGHWQHGVLETFSTQNSHPGSPFAVNHSRVLNAVQEARRAAQKAYDVPRVDERGNKAVAAANKSANAARVAAVKAVQKKMHNSSIDAPVSMV